jgi:hypothetical protein
MVTKIIGRERAGIKLPSPNQTPGQRFKMFFNDASLQHFFLGYILV